MNKLYDLCVATRTYKSNGQDKTNWENVGALLQTDDGKKFIMLKAHFNPAAIQAQGRLREYHYLYVQAKTKAK